MFKEAPCPTCLQESTPLSSKSCLFFSLCSSSRQIARMLTELVAERYSFLNLSVLHSILRSPCRCSCWSFFCRFPILVEYSLMQQWSDRLLRAKMQEAPPGYQRAGWSQLVAADKKLFSELRDLTREGRQECLPELLPTSKGHPWRPGGAQSGCSCICGKWVPLPSRQIQCIFEHCPIPSELCQASQKTNVLSSHLPSLGI